MVRRWVDHGIYAAYAAIPPAAQWGIPQDGDGLAKGASTASAVAQIKFSAVPGVSGGSITIFGATLASIATLGAAADADSAAEALATAINASTVLVPVDVTPNIVATPATAYVQLRSLVYARGPKTAGNPAPAGTCQIMTRVGSVNLNYTANVKNMIVTSAVTNISSTLADQQFKGGLSGCYGYLFTVATMWPQSVGAYQYGLWANVNSMGFPVQPGDIVSVRSNKSIPANGPNTSTSAPELGAYNNLVTYVYDDGTEWPEDGPEPVLRIAVTNLSSAAIWAWYSGAYVYHKGTRYSGGQRNVVFELTSGGDYASAMSVQMSAGSRIDCFDWYGLGYATPYLNVQAIGNQGAWHAADLYDCRFSWPFSKTGNRFALINSNTVHRVNFHGGVMEQRGAIQAQDAIFGMSTNNTARLVFTGTEFKGFATGSRLMATGATWAIGTHIFQNCKFADGINDPGPNWRSAINALVGFNNQFGQGNVIISNSGGKQETIVDSVQGLVGWWPSGGYPTLNARLRDGTPYSYRIAPNVTATTSAPSYALETPRFATRTNASANTVTLNLLMEKSMGWTTSEVAMTVLYEDADGAPHEETNWAAPGFGQALTPNAAAWTKLASDPADSAIRVSYANDTIWLNRYEMKLKTRFPIRVGSDVIVSVRTMTPAARAEQQLFIDPYPLLTQE
jgi:hypothetical protein